MAAENAWHVEIEPVDVTGPQVIHDGGDDVIGIPEQIRARVVGLPWDVRFTVRQTEGPDPIPQISELHVTQRVGGAPLGADLIRIFQLGKACDDAVRMAATRWIRHGQTLRLDFQPLDAGSRADERRLHQAIRRRRGRVSEDSLRDAAKSYLEAIELGRRDRLVYVSETCQISKPTASRYLERARQAGILAEDL